MSISDKVEDELLMDRAVETHLIDVTTVDGIVTLSGSVDNILAKERAARIARIIKGVRAVVNKISVDPSILRTDWQIREDVEEALLTDPATDLYEITVKVENNVVVLSGKVESWQEKNLCETVAKGVRGVKNVNNNIMIFWPQKRDDYEIITEVEKVLQWDIFVDHGLIDVNVIDGNVTLTGTVGSAAEKKRAGLDAHVYGVKSVDDSGLEVKRWARDPDLKGKKYNRKSNKEIENAVKDALLYDPRVFSFKVTPEVDGASVILRGTVDNLKAKRAAAQDARNTVGVLMVDNRIKVRPATWLSDEKLEDKVSNAILRDPYLEGYKIIVDVQNRVVKLYGTVNTYFERKQADDVASRVDGIIFVENNLKVQTDYEPDLYNPYVDDGYIYNGDWYNHRPRFPAKTDSRIKQDIEHELFWSPFVDADDVNITVNDGRVTLKGSVDSWSEYNAAVNNAYEGGAVYVDNELMVK
jgi:osmotically-inducible protein OsmY